MFAPLKVGAQKIAVDGAIQLPPKPHGGVLERVAAPSLSHAKRL